MVGSEELVSSLFLKKWLSLYLAVSHLSEEVYQRTSGNGYNEYRYLSAVMDCYIRVKQNVHKAIKIQTFSYYYHHLSYKPGVNLIIPVLSRKLSMVQVREAVQRNKIHIKSWMQFSTI